MSAGTALDIALLSPCYWPEVRRGSERFVHGLSAGLLARGHRPRLITSHPGRPTRRVEEGMPILRHWRPPEGWLVRRSFEPYLTHAPLSYASLRLGHRADVAHAVYPTDALVAARWARRTGRPAVFSFMGIPDRAGLDDKRLRPRIVERAIAGSSAVVALSAAAAAAFRQSLDVEAQVIAPGVDLETFRPGPPRAGAPTIFCAASLAEPRKRVALLVSAFGLVRRERPDARLVLSRPREADAARAVGAHGPGIELRDVDDRAELARTYAEAWVSALPSVGEAFGLVLLEAMACGTPGVGSNRDGIPEVISSPRVGRLFDGDDERALARALLEGLELAQDPATATACRAHAETFSAERCSGRYLDLYRQLLG